MNVFVTTDTHFNHHKLVEKGYRVSDYEPILLKSMKETKGELFIHLGDICIGKDAEVHKVLMEHLSGFKSKILVRGNHDHKSDNWYLEHGWDLVCEILVNKYYGKYVAFTHVPLLPDVLVDLEVKYREPVYNLHGHLHGKPNRYPEYTLVNKHHDLAPDIHDFKIVNLENYLNSL